MSLAAAVAEASRALAATAGLFALLAAAFAAAGGSQAPLAFAKGLAAVDRLRSFLYFSQVLN